MTPAQRQRIAEILEGDALQVRIDGDRLYPVADLSPKEQAFHAELLELAAAVREGA